ncbi:MAG: hypothetical protein NT026_02105 [Candidatus Staskawiczbacteria bacterium]|nr:hypothetical protein [Candidatus Staskawiczbacteria bacterium]
MKKLLVILLFSVILFFTAGFAIASVTNGVIDASNKYAWAENAGWINFGCAKSSFRFCLG